jgi:hypothetical protein
MIEIKMDSPNANPVNPNENNFQLNYTTETAEKSIFEMRVKELFELSFRAIRETQATVSCELSSVGDSLMIWVIDEAHKESRHFDGIYAINDYDSQKWPELARNSESNYRAAKCHLIRILQKAGGKCDE